MSPVQDHTFTHSCTLQTPPFELSLRSSIQYLRTRTRHAQVLLDKIYPPSGSSRRIIGSGIPTFSWCSPSHVQVLRVRSLAVSSPSLFVSTPPRRNRSPGCVCRLTSRTSVVLCFSQFLLLVSSLHFRCLLCRRFSLLLKPIYLQCLASRHCIVTVPTVLSSHSTNMTTRSHWRADCPLESAGLAARDVSEQIGHGTLVWDPE